MTNGTNRHPVDQLADVRETIKVFQKREAELRDALLAEGANLGGNEYYARIVAAKQSRLDRAKAEAMFGKDAVKRCCKEIEVTRIELVHREDEEP